MEAVHLFEMSMQPISGSRNYVYNLINSQNRFIRTSLLFQKSAKNKLPRTNLIPVSHHSFHSCAWFEENAKMARIAINRSTIALDRYLKSRKEEELILNAHHIGSMLLSAAHASVKSNIPILVTSHGTGIYQNYKNLEIIRTLERRVDRVVAVSKAVKRFIVSNTEFSPKRIEVIYPGVNTTEFSPLNFSNQLLQIYGDYVLFFGRIEREKGIMLLPDIAERLPKDMKLLVVGTGKNMKDLIRVVLKRKLTKKIIITGYLSEEILKSIVATAKVVLIPSVFEEPFPIVLLEAIASGVPVIVSKRGGMNEIKRHSGVIKSELEPDEFASSAAKLAMETTDKTKRSLIRMASEFSWESISCKYIDLYKKLV
jgi:glycosyltransferase involved in cell wall biosynthesis